MPTIKEIRDKYPQYDDMPDGVLAAKLHKAYYSDMPFKDFSAKINLFETPNKESLYEGFIKPTVKAIPKVVGSTATQMALMPGAGVKGVADLLGGKSLEEANRGMEETMSFVTPKLNTAEQQGVENIGLAMKPFQMAGEGWGMIGKATGIPYAEPTLATMGEAAAMFAIPEGAGKVKTQIKSLDQLRGMLEAQKQPAVPTRPMPQIAKPEPIPQHIEIPVAQEVKPVAPVVKPRQKKVKPVPEPVVEQPVVEVKPVVAEPPPPVEVAPPPVVKPVIPEKVIPTTKKAGKYIEVWKKTPSEYVADAIGDEKQIRLTAHGQLVKEALIRGDIVPKRVLEKYKNNGWADKALEALYNKKPEIKPQLPKEQKTYKWDDIDKAIEEAPEVKSRIQINKVGSKWELSYPKMTSVVPLRGSGVKPYESETTYSHKYDTKGQAQDAYSDALKHGIAKYPQEVNKVEIKSGHGGSYKIWNTKEALNDFKNRVQKQFPGKQSTTLFSGIDPTQIKNIGKWVANTAPARKVAGFFQPELSVPQGKEWLYSRQQAKGQAAIGEKYAEGFVKKHKDIKPEDRQLIWEQMNSGADIKTLPKELQKPALEFRILDNSLGKMLVDNGLMSEETFKANAGNHIRYIYNIYQQGGDLAMGMGQKLDTKFIKPRKDLSDLQRQQLGLVKDPIQAIANSIADTHRAVGMAQHFKTIAENPDWVFEPASVKIDGKKMGIGKVQKMIDAYQGVERSGQPLNETQVAYRDQLQTALQEAKAVSVPKDYIQLNGSQYGALDGQYVRKAIAQDIKPILDVFKSSSETANKVVSGIVAANGLWKMKNVALNIPTAARNTISNPSQLLMSGMRPDRVVTRTAQAIVEMAKKGKYHDEALQQGLFKGNFATGELEDIIQIARGFDANNWTGFLSKVQSLGKYYGKIDDVFKLAKFIDVREAGKPATEAAYQANKWGMDYSVAHPAIKILRNSPIGAPFISYQYKIAPLIAESLVKRPWIVGGIASIPWLLQKAVTQNMTDEDATKYIESLPEYVKNKQVFLIPGVNGMNALDVSYMVPWGNWFQVADSVRDTKVSKAFKQMGVASGLLPSVLYGVTTGKDLFTGEKIISDLEKYDPKAAAWATTKWIWQQAAPPMLTETSVVGKVSEHIKHGQTSKGLKTEGINVWPRIVGVNIYPVDPSGKAKAERFELKNVRKALIRKMYDKNISAEERKAATDAYRMAVQKVRPQPEEERTEETDSEI